MGDADFVVASIYKDDNNRINLYSTDDDNMAFYIIVGGVSDNVAYNASGIAAGTSYLVEIEYGSTTCTLSIDGVVKATATPAGGIDFGANIPDMAYIGANHEGERQSGAVFSAP